MSALSEAINDAYKTSGNLKEANKAYIEFIKANFIIPIESTSLDGMPQVLFLSDNNLCFLPVFSEQSALDDWAKDIIKDIKILKLSGVDLLKGIGDDVTISLNIGSQHYKEFNPSEISRMKSLVLKFFKD